MVCADRSVRQSSARPSTRGTISHGCRRSRLRQHGSAAGGAYDVGRRNGAVGSARQGAERAGVEAARLQGESFESSVRVAAVRRHAAADAWRSRRQSRREGFRAAKFGWGPIGRGSVKENDVTSAGKAREGLGADGITCSSMSDRSSSRTSRGLRRGYRHLEAAGAVWLESHLRRRRMKLTVRLSKRSGKVRPLAGGEGAHDIHMARHLIDYGGVGFAQIDCGRIGGIGPAKWVADYATAGKASRTSTTRSHRTSRCRRRCSRTRGSPITRFASSPLRRNRWRRRSRRTNFTETEMASSRHPMRRGSGSRSMGPGFGSTCKNLEIRVNGRTLYETPTGLSPRYWREPCWRGWRITV